MALGPHSRPTSLARLDGRTGEAKLVESLRQELVAHVGGRPSVAQRLLIEQATTLRLRIALMDRKFATDDFATERDHLFYLSWCNSLTRTLSALGMRPTPAASARAPTLEEVRREFAR